MKLFSGRCVARNVAWNLLGIGAPMIAALFAIPKPNHGLGVGRPDLTRKLHLSELLVYAALLWWLVHEKSIEGAAMAWTSSVGLDAVALFFLSRKLLGTSRPVGRRKATAAFGAFGVMCVGANLPDVLCQALWLDFSLVVIGLSVCFWLLSREERNHLYWRAGRAAEMSL